MASTTFVDGETLIEASWLNDVNAAVYTPGTVAAADISNAPNTGSGGNISSTNVQAAINELDSEKQPLDATLTSLAGLATGANKIPYSTGTDLFSQLDYSIDGTFASNVDTKIPSEKAVKTYTDTKVAASIAAIPYTGHTIQTIYSSTTAVATDTVTIPYDDTIPQNTEGTQYLSATITPSSTTNKLLIEVLCNCAGDTSGIQTIALFQDSTTGALAVGSDDSGAVNVHTQVALRHYMDAGTTSATTFKVRGGSSAGTQTLNGEAGTRRFGGVYVSSIKITEIKV